MSSYIRQYKFITYLSWILVYFIHPTWAVPVSVTARCFILSGLLLFFLISGYITNRWLKFLPDDTSETTSRNDISIYFKNNVWLFIICGIAVVTHLRPISTPIYLVGDEALFLQGGLWVYDYLGSSWHRIAKYAIWAVSIAAVVIIIRKSNSSSLSPSGSSACGTSPFIFLFPTILLLIAYFVFLRKLPHDLSMVSYPPLYKFLYLVPYSIFGITHYGPRVVQLSFYILSAVYLYQTIRLTDDRETALLGSTIYLFSPLVFDYAHFAELHAGVLFFMILISYYLLRFLIYQDDKDLLLSSCFIGLGFLYKRDLLLMFFICFAYLFIHKFKNRNLHERTHFKILLLSLIPIIPWLIIGKLYYWRDAWISLSRLVRFDTATVYFLIIPDQLSWAVVSLFVLSIIYVLAARRDHVILFWGFLFISFYLFYTAQYFGVSQRFAMAFYPTIGIFVASFLRAVSLKTRGKHAFTLIYIILTIYLIGLCTVPAFRTNLLTYRDTKAQYFPNEEAMIWVRDNVKTGEKILSLHFKPDMFYRDKYDIDKNKIIVYWTEIREYFPTPQELRAFCITENVSYILSPDGPSFLNGTDDKFVFNYLKEDRVNFEQIKSFNLGENYIYIHKLKNSI